MLWYHIWILAIIQGITEFLPISSSAHLILPSQLLGWPDQGLTFDVAVHAGTLVAVMLYFRHDLMRMLSSLRLMRAGTYTQASIEEQQQLGLVFAVVLGTLPAGVLGLVLNELTWINTRSILVIASTTLLFGLLLGWADFKINKQPVEKHLPLNALTLKHVAMIGFSQALALIPGTSRSGITITSSLLLGYSRQASARFSFLLSMPLIAAAGLLKTWEWTQQQHPIAWDVLLTGFLISAVSAFICIRLFLHWIDKVGMLPFVIYRVLLAVVLFAVAFWGMS